LPESGINLVSHLENLEKTYVVEALKQTGGNQTRAAELLQMPVRSLRHLLDKHEIARCQRRCEAANNAENARDFALHLTLLSVRSCQKLLFRLVSAFLKSQTAISAIRMDSFVYRLIITF
jgi:hypothetical protein